MLKMSSLDLIITIFYLSSLPWLKGSCLGSGKRQGGPLYSEDDMGWWTEDLFLEAHWWWTNESFWDAPWKERILRPKSESPGAPQGNAETLWFTTWGWGALFTEGLQAAATLKINVWLLNLTEHSCCKGSLGKSELVFYSFLRVQFKKNNSLVSNLTLTAGPESTWFCTKHHFAHQNEVRECLNSLGNLPGFLEFIWLLPRLRNMIKLENEKPKGEKTKSPNPIIFKQKTAQ